jgi:hypothetical protein
MRVLVACEFSGAVRDACAARGHDDITFKSQCVHKARVADYGIRRNQGVSCYFCRLCWEHLNP